MGLAYVNKLSLMALCPTAATVVGLPSISAAASYSGALSVNAQFSTTPPAVPDILAELSLFEANITAAIGLSLPSLSFSVSDCVSLSADLNVALVGLPTLQSLLGDGSVGIFSYAYAGNGNALGGALTTELASTWGDGSTPTSGTCTALIFGLVDDSHLSPAHLSTIKFGQFLSGLTLGGAGLVYGGKLTLGALAASITPDVFLQAPAILNAQLAASASLQASLAVTPPTLPEDLIAISAAAANLTALPSPQFVIDASAALAANFSTNFGALLELGGILGFNQAQAFVYLYTGAANALGAAVTTSLSSTWGDGTTSTSGASTAIVLGAADFETTIGMLDFFGGA